MDKWHLYHPAFLIVNNVQAARGDRGLLPVDGAQPRGAPHARRCGGEDPGLHPRHLATSPSSHLWQLQDWSLFALEVSAS